jgi:hydrogenase nickel incorporation protein HypA/HybF
VHELSLAQDILEIAEAEARRHHASSVTLIKLLLGDFAGVVRDALEFSFEVARAGTMAESASLEIERVPIETRCPGCAWVARPPVNDLSLRCPRCGLPLEIVSGRELRVEYVEIE